MSRGVFVRGAAVAAGLLLSACAALVGIDEDLTVKPGDGGATRHFHDDRVVSGSQSGTNVADWWLSVDDDTLVRLKRQIDVDYSSGGGKIHYTETLDMTLRSSPATSDAGAD